MATLIYSDDVSNGGASNVPYEKWNACKAVLTHYGNLLYLDFLAKNTKDVREAAQARHEITIAERKMNWWKHHPNYCAQTITRGCEKLKKDWNK